MRVVLSTLFGVAMLCAVLVAATADVDPKTVVFTQLVHRHGARTPTGIHSDHNAACGSLGCGLLTTEGKDMLFKLGLWARNRYMLLPNTTADTTAYINNYSYFYPHRIVQRSTDVSRTLQSAAAFLQGLFDNAPSSFYPVINTVPIKDDSLLYVSSIPAYEIYHDVEKHHEKKHFSENYLLPTIPAQVWTALGEELLLSKQCDSSITDFGDCFKEIYDVCESYYSSGTLTTAQYPLSTKYYPTLKTLMEIFHSLTLVWKQDEHTDAHRGPLGRNIITEIMSQIQLYIDSEEKADLIEYSTEDTTLCVLSDTLGQSQYQLPQFGATIVFELLTNVQGAYFLRLIHGSPSQEPGDHNYTMSYFNMTCIDDNGNTYNSQQEGCKLADFARYFATRIGSSSEGYCYLRPDIRTAIKCDRTGSDELPDKKCSWYRTMCPEYACPSGYYLQWPNLVCRSV